jgi:pimeloyl-ACP methyl ester carboxylesterase
MNSNLVEDHRLVALDLRGHGLSDKPQDGYDDSRQWADDVQAVIEALQLDHPVLSGWSYGPLVFLDYIRHYGEDGLGGVQFVGGVWRLGNKKAIGDVTPEFLALVPQFFSDDTATSVRGLEGLVRLCYVREPSTAERYLMLGYGVSVPPYVRKGLFSRSVDNGDLLPGIRKPVLITYGAADAVVRSTVVDELRAAIPHAEVHVMRNVGHAPFWDDAPGFNERLRTFCKGVPV